MGSMNTLAQPGYHDQVIAFKGHGAWMCFVGWDLAAVAGPFFGTFLLGAHLCISACPGTSWLTEHQE